jgi:hypothetical protein
MSGKRAAGGWGPWSTALLVTASVAMVVWVAVAASMLFATHHTVPIEQAASTSQTPSLSPMTGSTTLPPALYTASKYSGPLPTHKTKRPTTTAHPGETPTTGPTGGTTTYPGPTGYPTYPTPTLPTIYPTSSPTPTHGHGHTHGPH